MTSLARSVLWDLFPWSLTLRPISSLDVYDGIKEDGMCEVVDGLLRRKIVSDL